MGTERILLFGLVLLAAGCAAATSPEARLRNEIFRNVYWDAARACETHRTLHVDDAGLDGEVTVSGDSGSSQGLSEFIQCYREGIRQRVEHRRQAGLPLTERLNLEPGVRFEPDQG